MRTPLIPLLLLLISVSPISTACADTFPPYYADASHREESISAAEIFDSYQESTQLEHPLYQTGRSDVWSRISELELITLFESPISGPTHHQDMFGKASLSLLPPTHGFGIELNFRLNFR